MFRPTVTASVTKVHTVFGSALHWRQRTQNLGPWLAPLARGCIASKRDTEEMRSRGRAFEARGEAERLRNQRTKG